MNFPNLMREMSNLTSLFLELDGGEKEEGGGEKSFYSRITDRVVSRR